MKSSIKVDIDAAAREFYGDANLVDIAEKLVKEIRREAKWRWGLALPTTRWRSSVGFYGSTASVCFTCVGGQLRFWDIEFNVEGRTKVTVVSSRVELL